MLLTENNIENEVFPPISPFPSEKVKLGWNYGSDRSVGAGMFNLGNTCYMNSTLQALFHVPSFVNWLNSEEERRVHASKCQDSGKTGDLSCVICAVRETLEDTQRMSGDSIRPHRMANILGHLSRDYQPGRQQDAHEFLRSLIEKMREAYLTRFENLRSTEINRKVLETTTPLDQIFGGLLSSGVKCGKCSHVSTTTQTFLDLPVDVEFTQTLDQALDAYFAAESLETYGCENCGKKVGATKQFTVERAPKVLCLQLKRFSYFTNEKISKHVRFRRSVDLRRHCTARCQPSSSAVYKLVALMSHHGTSSHRGHYTAVGQAPSGSYYLFDDRSVSGISYNDVSQSEAYVMFYELTEAAADENNNKENNIAKNYWPIDIQCQDDNKRRTASAIPAPVGYTTGWNPNPNKSKNKKNKRKRGNNKNCG